MFKKLFYVLPLAFALFFSPLSIARTYSDIYVFGDSLSDMGNAAAVLGDLPRPPYFQNRVTNGRVAVEALANKLGLKTDPSLYFLGTEQGTNYAVAGASASENGEGDLGAQVASFLALNLFNAPSDAIYIIFIGGNDVRDARGELNPLDPADLEDALAILDQATFNIGVAIHSLIGWGSRHIVVVNSPNIGVIPETTMAANTYNLPWLPEVVQNLTNYFNSRLAVTINQVEISTGVDIGQFDLFSTFNNLLANAYLLDITNTTDPCYLTFGNNYLPVLNPLCVDAEFNPDPNSFFFIDEIHPTKNVHKAIGKEIARQIKFSD